MPVADGLAPFCMVGPERGRRTVWNPPEPRLQSGGRAVSEPKGLALDFTGDVRVCGESHSLPHPTEEPNLHAKAATRFEGCMAMSFPSSLKVPWDNEWRN